MVRRKRTTRRRKEQLARISYALDQFIPSSTLTFAELVDMYGKSPIDLLVHLQNHVPSAQQVDVGMSVLREQGAINTDWLMHPGETLLSAVQIASGAPTCGNGVAGPGLEPN